MSHRGVRTSTVRLSVERLCLLPLLPLLLHTRLSPCKAANHSLDEPQLRETEKLVHSWEQVVTPPTNHCPFNCCCSAATWSMCCIKTYINTSWLHLLTKPSSRASRQLPSWGRFLQRGVWWILRTCCRFFFFFLVDSLHTKFLRLGWQFLELWM